MTTIRWRVPLLILGWALVALAPVAGLLPGPSGIFLFGSGLALLLRSSPWVRRRYVMLERRWPRLGALVDRVLRRHSHRHGGKAPDAH